MRYFFLFCFSISFLHTSFSQPKRKMYETSTTCNLFIGYNGSLNGFNNWLNLYHFEVEQRISKTMYLLAGTGFNRYYFHNLTMPMNFTPANLGTGNGYRSYELKLIRNDFYFSAGLEKKFKAMGDFTFSLKSNLRLGFVSKSYYYSKYYMVNEYGTVDYGPYYSESRNYGGYANFPPDYFCFEITPCLEYKRTKASYYFQTSLVLFPDRIPTNFFQDSPYICFQLGMRLFKSPKGS